MSGKNKVAVIAGPSGSGKNAIINEILQRYQRCVRLVTATTRKPRPGDVDGVDYHFLTEQKFERGMARGDIPEHRFIKALNTYYGIYLPDLEEKIKTHALVFAQVDIIGARLLKERYGASTIFIMPENIQQFGARLQTRNPDMSDREFDARM